MSSAEYSILVGLPPMTLFGNFFSSTELKLPSDIMIIRCVSMAEQNEININYLHRLALQESETDTIQKIDSNLYNSISDLIKNLKSEGYDGVKEKINQAMIKMISDTTSVLLKLRLEKATLENSNQSVLLDEEKYILDSKKEMLERKEVILSGILNGKPHCLDDQ